MPPSRTRKGRLTELEGAILAAVRRAGTLTAYRLRQAFLVSASMEWSGSAGAVYPAMRRLRAAGLLTAQATDDGRGTEHYRLTKQGDRALRDWSADITRAVSAGMDPFRSRAPEWLALSPRERTAVLKRTKSAIEARCTILKAELAKADPIAAAQPTLELDLQQMRLRWIAAQ
jgi:DNA-binding PadR family transcriptional regulator